MDAIYRLNGRTAETSSWAAGPWSDTQQHGSAPAALVAWTAEQIPTPQPMRVARLTIDLLRPVPIAPLDIATEILREGRKIQLVAVHLSAGGVEVARATVLKVRALDTDLPAIAEPPKPDLPPPPKDPGESPLTNTRNAFMSGMTLHEVKGAFRTPGPAAVWTRANRRIVEGAGITQLMRAVITSDFCNGVSSVLDFEKWIYINGDLTVSLARMPVGEWILLDAESWMGPEGAGIATGRLADVNGYFGRAVQSLVIEPR